MSKPNINTVKVSIEKTIRRMDIIVRSILKDLIDSKEEMTDSINYRDFDVNRLYFLLFKIVKSALKDPNIAKIVGIDKNIDIFCFADGALVYLNIHKLIYYLVVQPRDL